jgi:hypothetical protein
VATAVIVCVGVFFLGMGVYGLAAPAALARPFRMKIDSPESRSEVRAVYGGFGVAVSGALAGMALGRLVSRVLDTSTSFYPVWFYFCVEVVGAGVLFLAV